MKVAILVLVLLGLGVGGLFALTQTGATSQNTSIAKLLSAEGSELSKSQRLEMTCQIAVMHSRFDPIEFDAYDVGKSENETPAEADKRFENNPRIRVVYRGHDQIPLENFNHVHITGRWDAEAKVFQAEKLSTQCPSHYEGDNAQTAPVTSTP